MLSFFVFLKKGFDCKDFLGNFVRFSSEGFPI